MHHSGRHGPLSTQNGDLKMSTEHPLSQPPVKLVTSCDIEHPHALGRRIKAGLTLVGAAAAAVLALAGASPSANADTVELPDFPTTSGDQMSPESLGIPLLFGGEAYEQNGSYTDLLGTDVDTAGIQSPNGPLEINDYEFPAPHPSLEVVDYVTPGVVASVSGGGFDGDIGGSTFSALITPAGFYNFYEDTPFVDTGASSATDNINDVWAFDPTGIPLADPSGIEFGIQYLDLPDAFSGPVDELNFLGSGGEILFSLPVTGDLLSLF
jgi:hypothetical protein